MRVRIGAARRRKKKRILKRAKGYYLLKSKAYRYAKQAVMRAEAFAYVGRKIKKRDFRKLWIIRINAATEQRNLPYHRFINGLKKANVALNRKMLSEIAIRDPQAFDEIVKISRGET